MQRIRAVALDVDGVLTDGSIWWGPNGEEWKRFAFHDIMGVSRGSKAGLTFALISGEDSPLVDRYARKMNITAVYKGIKDKASALRDFATRGGFDLSEVAFMGDDINDASALEICGLPAVPANAHASVRALAEVVTQCAGGNGAVRELIDALLAARA